MIQVLIVDDHAIVRHGLQQLLAAVGGVHVVGAAADGFDAVEAARRLRPDVILMDVVMPGVDGIEATRRITATDSAMQVVMLTSSAERHRVVDSVSAGACGYLLKDGEPDEVVSAVRAAHAGGAPFHPQAARVLIDAHRRMEVGPTLSGREREVLGLVVDGLANKQIARRLGIAERTVKAHLTAVFQQLGVSDRTQAALWARDHLVVTS